MHFIPNPKEGVGRNSPPLLLIVTLMIKVSKQAEINVDKRKVPLNISSSLTCGGILNVSCITLLVSSVITVMLFGCSPIHNLLTYQVCVCVCV